MPTPNFVNAPRGAVQSLYYVWNVGTLEWVVGTQPGTVAGGVDGALVDGVTSSIRATVKDYLNSNPLTVVLVDTSGDPYVAGGATGLTDTQLRASAVPVSLSSTTISGTVAATQSGTWDEVGINDSGNSITVDGTFFQATQPVSAAALPLPSGAASLAAQTQPGIDIGDVTVNNGAGAASVNIQDGGNSITVDGTVAVTNLDVALSTRLKPADTLAAVTSITNVVHIDDNAGSVTIDNANLDVALSTRLKPADTLAAVTSITNVVHVDDNASTISIDDGAGSITVDGTVAVSNFPATQPVSGTVAVSGSVAVTGPLTDTQLRTTPVPVSGTVSTTSLSGSNVDQYLLLTLYQTQIIDLLRDIRTELRVISSVEASGLNVKDDLDNLRTDPSYYN